MLNCQERICPDPRNGLGTYSLSLVAQNGSIQITLAISKFMENWAVEMVGIEVAFLEAKLDNDLH